MGAWRYFHSGWGSGSVLPVGVVGVIDDDGSGGRWWRSVVGALRSGSIQIAVVVIVGEQRLERRFDRRCYRLSYLFVWDRESSWLLIDAVGVDPQPS